MRIDAAIVCFDKLAIAFVSNAIAHTEERISMMKNISICSVDRLFARRSRICRRKLD